MKVDNKILQGMTERDAITHAESGDGLAVARLGYIVTYHAAREPQGKRPWKVANRHGEYEWFREWRSVLFFLATEKKWRYI
jgi:hypothetical protein